MPELGKATYYLELNTAELDSGLPAAEARINKATTSMANKMGMVVKSSEEMGAAVGEAAGDITVAAGQMSMEFEEVGAAATTMGTEVAAGAGEAAGASEAAAAKVGIAWGAAAKKVEAAGKRTSAIGKTMMHKITLPALIVGGVGIKMAFDYSQKLKLLQTQAGATKREMLDAKKGIANFIDQGTIHGPTALADAMYHIESAGLRGTAALNLLHTASKGAQVGNADLEETTYALVSAMETGMKDATDLGSTMGTLNAIVGAGDMRLQDLTAALSTGIGPAAKSAGLGLKDVGAAIDTMTARGMPAQISATRLGMTIAMMQKPTSAAAKALAKIGIGQLDLARIMREKGLAPALEYLRMKLEAIKDPAERSAVVLQAFGGGRSGKAMLLLLQNLDDMKERLAQVTKGAKGFDDAVKESDEEPINKLRKAWTKLQLALVNLGAEITPTIASMATWIAKGAAAFDKLNPSVKKVVIIVIALAAAMGPLMMLFGPIISLIGALTGAMIGLSAATVIAAAPWIALGLAIAAVVAIFAGAMLAPKQFTALLVRMGVGLKTAQHIVEGLRAAFSVLWRTALLELRVFFAYFKTVWKVLYDVVRIFIDVFTGDWSDMWERIKDIPKTALKGIEDVFRGVVDTIKGIWGDLGTWLKMKAVSMALAVVEPFSHLPGRFGKWARDAKDELLAELNTLGTDDRVAQMAAAVAANYGNTFVPAMGAVGQQAAVALLDPLNNTKKPAIVAIWSAELKKWVDTTGKALKDQQKAWDAWNKQTHQSIVNRKPPRDRTVLTTPLAVPKTSTPTPTKPTGTTDPWAGIDLGVDPLDPSGKKKGSSAGTAEFPVFPAWIQRRALNARQTKKLSDDKTVLQMEITWLKKLLASRQWSIKKKGEILDALDTAKSSLKDLNAKIAAALELPDVVLWTTRMQLRETRAERTKGLADDLRVQLDELAYLKKLLAHTGRKKKDMERRLQIEQEITAVLLKIRDLKDQQNQTQQETNSAGMDMARNVLNERASFFSSFGGNVFQTLPGGATGTYKLPGTGARGIPGYTYTPDTTGVPATAKRAGASAGQHLTARQAMDALQNQYKMNTRAGLRAAALRYVTGGDTSAGGKTGVSGADAAAGAAGLGKSGKTAGLGGDAGMSSREVTIRTPLVRLYATRVAHGDAPAATRKGQSHVTVNLNHLKEATVDKYREAMYASAAFRHAFDGGEAVGG